MKAIVLVGGAGTRLRPLTYSTPKPLLPIANQAFLERQLTWLAHHGVDEVVLSLGYLPDAFEAHFPEGRFGDLKLRYVVEDHPLGTAGAIRFAARGIEERIVVCNGDVLTTLDLDALVAFHDARRAEATIFLTRVADPSAFGVVPTRPDGEVVAFVEKPPKGRAPTNWINGGTYVLEPSVLDRIPERLTVSIERETFPRMLDEPSRLYAMTSDRVLDRHRDAREVPPGAHRRVARRARRPRPRPAPRELTPGVWVQGTPDIDADARLEAPTLIGNRSIIGPGARIVGSVVGAGVVVGSGARLLRSVVHDDATIGEEAEAIDSVVGERAVLGDGAIASDHTVMGHSSSLAPGARASGARVRRPEPDGKD